MDDRTPVIIGVGEASERIDSPDYAALSPADLAGRAAAEAVADAGAVGNLAGAIQLIAAIRQFEVSAPRAVAPFGKADNFPRAVAKRIGANPERAILEPVGGQGPQHLINELAQVIGRGELEVGLICGSEAISTVRHLASRGETRDWSEALGGQLEDRGYGEALLTADLARHGARTPICVYAMFENARRGRLGLDRAAYAVEMGRLFAPFTKVAAHNPHAMSREVQSVESLATVTASNRLVADPFTRRVVARDQANQGAAVIIASLAKARELGVPEDRIIYLHGGADVRERTPMERSDWSASPASVLAARRALEAAGIDQTAVEAFDFYSCFPIAVFNVRDGLGIAADDPRPLTVTGGLPFFGGAGNNYSMHAVVTMMERLRADREAYGLSTGNGWFLTKQSTGIYSAQPPRTPFEREDLAVVQRQIDALPHPQITETPRGSAVIETYTVVHARKGYRMGIVIGRDADGRRFVANTPRDEATLSGMEASEQIGRRGTVGPAGDGVHNLFVPE